MIKYRNGDLLKQSDINVILHQCNCFNTMGAGIARTIASRYPSAKAVDASTIRGSRDKMGTYTWIREKGKMIINMYSQFSYGKGTQTDYNEMAKAFNTIKMHLSDQDGEVVLGIPYNMGCGLAGGDWYVVDGLINDIFGDANFDVVICKLLGNRQ